jgi:hypothetical protein
MDRSPLHRSAEPEHYAPEPPPNRMPESRWSIPEPPTERYSAKARETVPEPNQSGMERPAMGPQIERAPDPRRFDPLRSVPELPERTTSRPNGSYSEPLKAAPPHEGLPEQPKRVSEPRRLAAEAQHETPGERDSAEPEEGGGRQWEPTVSKWLDRLMSVGRAALPVVPHVLPMEGKIGATVAAATALSNVLVSRPQPAPPPPPERLPAPPVAVAPTPTIDTKAVEDKLTGMETAHRELTKKVIDQNASLERVEEHIQLVQEIFERERLDLQDLLRQMKLFSKWALVFAVAVAMLLAASVGFNVVLLLRQ